ncbi:response regulator transcription factor [Oceanibium sediminis]|uniref:response regulator transcription factor n=1 Tax=Oceanibium sediminis TaxID=2026339 RepID=UPI000DD4AF14|nr:response regulator transcription factor [Oceanibium sediminis]
MTSDEPRLIRVLIADDHPLVVQGVAGVLETYDGIVVVGTASNGKEVLVAYERLMPDIVLMDLNMPEMNGLAATELLLERDPGARVLILSMHDTPEYIATAMRHGARGYVLKDVDTDDIVTAINTVYAGGTYLCTGTAQVMDPEDGREPLTSREQTVLLALASGKSNREVAEALEISIRTVETHRKNIKRKLGISSTAGLTRYALENGVLQA